MQFFIKKKKKKKRKMKLKRLGKRKRCYRRPSFIMQPLIVGVTPIGRKYELRLAEIAWRTLPYLRVRKNPFPRPLFIRKRRPSPMNQNGRQPLPRPPSLSFPPPSFFPANNCQRQVPPVTRQKLNGTRRRNGCYRLN